LKNDENARAVKIVQHEERPPSWIEVALQITLVLPVVLIMVNKMAAALPKTDFTSRIYTLFGTTHHIYLGSEAAFQTIV